MTRIILNILLAICVLTFKVSAQINYVLNPGFELYNQCPTTYYEIFNANFWNQVDTVDSVLQCGSGYSNECGSSYAGIPGSGNYYHYAHSGKGMAITTTFGDSTYSIPYSRVYVQGRLYKTLMFGKKYCVTYYVSLAQCAIYASNHFDAYFDDGYIDSGQAGTYACTLKGTFLPQIVDTNLIVDTLGWDINISYAPGYGPGGNYIGWSADSPAYDRTWVKVQGSFIANGTEKFITLGNFNSSLNTQIVRIQEGGGSAVYLIDDVSVVESDAVADAGSDTVIHPGDNVWIGNDTAAVGGGDGMPCWWYKKGSTTAFDSGGRIQVHPDTTTTYIMMMDLCGNITHDTVTVNVWPAGVGMVYDKPQNYYLFPNPNNGNITIRQVSEDNNPINIEIWDIVGQAVYENNVTFDNGFYKLQLPNIASGMYLLQIKDIKERIFKFKFVKE